VAGEFDRVRAAVSERLRTGTSNQLVDSVLLLLRSRSQEPDLGFLFGASGRVARSVARPVLYTRTVIANQPPSVAIQGSGQRRGMTGAGTTVGNGIPATSATMVPPMGAVPARNTDDLLKDAQSRGTLDALERAAVTQWEKHRSSSRLGALVTLARFARGDIRGAAEAAGRWSTLLAARRDLAGQVEALWIVGRCLDHNETVTLGRKLAGEVLPAARARGLRAESIDLTIRLIKSAVSADQKDEALAELQRLQETLGPGSALPMPAP
jgi:hypothetical protein